MTSEVDTWLASWDERIIEVYAVSLKLLSMSNGAYLLFPCTGVWGGVDGHK